MTGTILPPPSVGEPPVPSPVPGSRLPWWRRRWVFVVAALVLVVGGVAIYAAISSTEDEPHDADVEQVSSDQLVRESIAAATEAASAARTARYVMTTTIDGVEATKMDSAVDYDAGVFALTVDFNQSVLGGEGPDRMETILDQERGMWYLGADAFDFPTDASWVSIDVAAMTAPLGVSAEDFQSDASAPLLNITSLLDTAIDVVDLGIEELDNVEVRHFQLILETDEFLSANPDLLEMVETEGLEDEMPAEIPYDLWITEANQLHRIAFGFEVAGLEMLTELDFVSIGVPLDIEIPASQDVVDMADLDLG